MNVKFMRRCTHNRTNRIDLDFLITVVGIGNAIIGITFLQNIHCYGVVGLTIALKFNNQILNESREKQVETELTCEYP